jgi:acyl-CoA synthetase (AMP-forming)/AMP-acid ligase II
LALRGSLAGECLTSGLEEGRVMSSLDKSDTFTDLLSVQVRERPDATAMIFGERSTSYGELDRYSNRIANGLIGLGIENQERIGYLGKNSDHYFALLLGATKAGAVLVPINWRLAPAEIATILADAGITLLFVGCGFGDVARGLSVSRQLRCVSIDGANAEWRDYVAWRDEQSPDGPAVRVEAEHTFIQLYTAGTTGLPKGVELINRNFVGSVRAASQGGWGDWHPDDVILLCLPVSHIAASGLGLFGRAYGCTVVILEEVDPAAITESIAKHRVTTTLLVPAVIAMLVQHAIATRADFSSVRTLAYGASPVADALIEQAQTVFSNASLWQLYGLTESGGSGGAVLSPEMHDPALGKRRSCGKPPPGTAAQVIGPAGEQLAAGQVGELVIRVPDIMKDYWRNAQATAAAFHGNGWLRTGDAAYIDQDGFIYIQDRIKDMIITGGENVYPAEVENALYGHPAIADVAVIGVPDARWGEAVKAIVVLRPDQTATPDELIAYARERVAGYKLPKSVDFVDVLPRTAAGKVLKRELREQYWASSGRRTG